MAGAEPAGLSAGEEAGERAAFNTLVRAAGEVAGKLASLVLFAAVGRTLGEDGLGVFVFALSFGIVALIPLDLGFDTALLREVAADRSRAGPAAANVLAAKLALTGPVVLAAVLVVGLGDASAETRTVVYVLLLGLVLESLTRTATHLFMAFERSGPITLGVVVQRGLAAALGVALLLAGFGVVAVAWAYAAGAAAGLVLSAALLLRVTSLRGFRPSRAGIRELTGTLAFALKDIANVLLFRIDAVILSAMASTAAVGRYGAAYRLFESTWFVTVAIFGAFAAMFTYLDETTEPRLGAAFERALRLSLVALVPCAVAFALCAPALVELVFGAGLAGAADSLRILAPAVVLLGVAALATTLLLAKLRTTPVLVISFAAVAVNVALNAVLIPDLGAEGSALAMLATEALLAVAAMVYAGRLAGGVRWWSIGASSLAAGVAMAGATLALGSGLAALAAGLAVYAAVLVAVERVVNPEDARSVAAMVRRRLPASARV